MRRLLPLIGLVAALAAVAAGWAQAGQRMWVGFQDDPSFRWAEDREDALDLAAATNATVIRATVDWADIAPTRPGNGASHLDPAYRWENVDELVTNAQKRGLEVMLTVWGTPRWANGGQGKNRLPTRLADLTAFSRALATRYSGRVVGVPHVRFYSVWNEVNRELFLAPQFDAKGRSVAPANYARLYRAAYAGLKAGNPTAKVAIGETAANGRDKRTAVRGIQQTHSPGRFAQLLAQQKPRLQFDAWAHHPYPTDSRLRPTQNYKWPNVGLTSLTRFGTELDRWFGRKNTTIWVTEYGHQTGRGVTAATQAAYAAQALNLARANPRVEMFIWFVFQDRPETPWTSGLVAPSGAGKPALARFAAAARPVDARNPLVTTSAGQPTIRLSALPIGYYSPGGALLGTTWEARDRGVVVAQGYPELTLGRDGWLAVRLTGFWPVPGRTYVVRVEAHDVNGNEIVRTVTVVGAKKGVAATALPRP